MPTKTSYLPIIRLIFISLFFSFNFIDREISNVFLIATLLFCVIDYRDLVNKIRENKKIIYPIVLFFLWILMVAFYHKSPIHELDNYTRLLLLIPLLMINIERKYFKILIYVSALAAIGHGILYGDVEERYIGTSSSQITYAYLIITLLVLIINNTNSIRESPKSFIFSLVMIAGLIWVWTLTGTRGPLITLILCLSIIFYYKKSFLLPVIVLVLTTSLIYLNNDFYQRFNTLYDSILQTTTDIEDLSYLERKAYINYGFHTIERFPLSGIGPDNLENEMAEYFQKNSINVVSQDHLHNDYIDISAKFGIPGLILLLIIYLSLYKKIIGDNQSTSMLLLIILISSHLTQSQFAHHQIISFLISMIFVTLNTRSYDLQSKEKKTPLR